ncbi:MAG: DUF4280 domain-containing protein [Lachnospiraceae bacterium]|nr:DUF4280 domain-containing protein [Lachnospiraceae bacterium]
MSKYMVRDGAILHCCFGSCKGCLRATQINGVDLKDGKEAVITDFLPEVNIPSFGVCTSPLAGGECIPATILPWIQGKSDYLVGKIPALMDDSILPCLRGGIITVERNGQ